MHRYANIRMFVMLLENGGRGTSEGDSLGYLTYHTVTDGHR
jgi:hypothetical protein